MKVYNPPIKKIGEMYNKGMTTAEIAKKIGYSITTTRRWLEKYGIKPERREPNKTQDQKELESIKINDITCPYQVGETVAVTAEMVSITEGTFKIQRKIGKIAYKSSHNVGVEFENWRESWPIKSIGHGINIERMEA